MNEFCKNLSKPKIIMHIVILIAIMFVGDFVSSLPFDILFRYVKLPSEWMYPFIRLSACIVVTYLIFRFYTIKVLHSKMEYFRIGRLNLKATDVLFAILLPAFVIVGFLFIGKPYLNQSLTAEAILTIIIAALFRALKAGILEEMLFRGYIMKLLEVKWNKYIAIILPSFIFSLVHIPSMKSFDLLSLLLLICSGTLVGIMFSLVAYKNNSIWGSALIHTIWNLIICTNILHIYSGIGPTERAIFSIAFPSESPILTGAEFGIEASIIAIIGYALMSIFILLLIKKQSKNSHHLT